MSCVLQSLRWYACCLQQNRCHPEGEHLHPCRLDFVKLGSPPGRKLFCLVVFPENATCCVTRTTNREEYCRYCLVSFLIAWVCRIAANDGLGIVTVRPPATSYRQLVKHQIHAACQSHLSAIVSSIAILRFLVVNLCFNTHRSRFCYGCQQKTTMTCHRFFHLNVGCRPRLP